MTFTERTLRAENVKCEHLVIFDVYVNAKGERNLKTDLQNSFLCILHGVYGNKLATVPFWSQRVNSGCRSVK